MSTKPDMRNSTLKQRKGSLSTGRCSNASTERRSSNASSESSDNDESQNQVMNQPNYVDISKGDNGSNKLPSTDKENDIPKVIDNEEYTSDYLRDRIMCIEGLGNKNTASALAETLLDLLAKRDLHHLERIGELEAQININACRNDRLQKELFDTKTKLVELQRHQMAHNLWINDIPEQSPESTERLKEQVKKHLKTKLELENEDDLDFDTCHRIGSKSETSHRPVIVAFVRREQLHKIMKYGHDRRKADKTTPRMGIQQPQEYRAQLNVLKHEKDLILKASPTAEVTIRRDKLLVGDKVTIDLAKERAAVKPADANLTQTARTMTPFHGDTIGPHRGSFFQGHFIAMEEKRQLHAGLIALRSYKNISSATHNVWVLKIGNFIRCDDDGEDGATKDLIPLLKGRPNGLLMVSRFYGGKHMGPKRFTFFKEAGINALSYIS